MKEAIDPPAGGKAPWRRLFKPAVFIALGIIIAFPLFSITYYSMVRTTTPQFCAWCHEIQFAYNTWKTSTHVNNTRDLWQTVWTVIFQPPTTPLSSSMPKLRTVSRMWLYISSRRNTITKEIARRLMASSRTSNARSAIEISFISQTNEGPCWPTGRYCMPGPAMRSDVWIAIEISSIMPGSSINTNSIEKRTGV